MSLLYSVPSKKPVVSRQHALREFHHLKRVLQQLHLSNPSAGVKDGIAAILNDASFTAFKKIAYAALVIPMATAEVERGFSCMNDIKTICRNRLLASTLDQLMRISTANLSDATWDDVIRRACEIWVNLKPRQVDFVGRNEKFTDDAVFESESSDQD